MLAKIEKPQIARRSRCVKRVLVGLFEHVGEHLSTTFQKALVLQELYNLNKILPAIVSHYTEARPRAGLKLFHDNVLAHKSAIQLSARFKNCHTLPIAHVYHHVIFG